MAAPAQEDPRLGRIEKRVDEIAAAVVTLARVEERQTALFREQNRTVEMMGQLAARVSSVESTAPDRGAITDIQHRLAAIESAPPADPAGVAERLTEVERKADKHGFAVRFGERLFWIVATSIAGLGASVATFWTTKGP